MDKIKKVKCFNPGGNARIMQIGESNMGGVIFLGNMVPAAGFWR